MGGIISSGLHVAHERQDARLEGAELAEALALADLLGPERLERRAQLVAVLDEHVAVDAQKDGEERLDGLKVAVRAQALRERVDERRQVVERDERRPQLEVGRRRRERLEVREEGLDCGGGEGKGGQRRREQGGKLRRTDSRRRRFRS